MKSVLQKLSQNLNEQFFKTAHIFKLICEVLSLLLRLNNKIIYLSDSFGTKFRGHSECSYTI